MRWLHDLLYHRSLRRLHVLDRAHDAPSGDRRPLVITPDVKRIREEWDL